MNEVVVGVGRCGAEGSQMLLPSGGHEQNAQLKHATSSESCIEADTVVTTRCMTSQGFRIGARLQRWSVSIVR